MKGYIETEFFPKTRFLIFYQNQVWVNGKVVLDFDSKFPVEKGKIGLTTWGLAGEVTSFDDVIVSGDKIKGRPVNPKGKLTSVWGKIKNLTDAR